MHEMKIVVVGGNLQGIEAAYLARQAGWEVTLVDKDPCAPATGLCDRFFPLDVNEEGKRFVQIAREADLMIPALKDGKTLDRLVRLACQCACPVIFDQFCYGITSSKNKSESIFHHSGLPTPRPWPQCGLPVIVKPLGLRRNRAIQYIIKQRELTAFLAGNQAKGEDWAIREYLEGDCHSLEVIGCQGIYRTLQITDLEMDQNFDCKRVSASTGLTGELQREFRGLAEKIGAMINLEGIIHVEAVNHHGTLKVLEISARLPSLTPIAVYKSTELNMLTLLDSVYRRGIIDTALTLQETRAVVSEYIRVTSQKVEIAGQHMMTHAGPVFLRHDFFGAEEAITNYWPGQNAWVARLIHTGADAAEVEMKRKRVMENIQKHFSIPYYVDSAPKLFLGEYLEKRKHKEPKTADQ